MYAARSISTGEVLGVEGALMIRHRFPEMSDRAKELYVRAFGEKRYESYQSAVNNSTLSKEVDEELEMRHAGFHDVESFVWVLFHELLLAWPKSSADEELSDSALATLDRLEAHGFGCFDNRPALLDANRHYWKKRLHSGLSFLAESLTQIALYM